MKTRRVKLAIFITALSLLFVALSLHFWKAAQPARLSASEVADLTNTLGIAIPGDAALLSTDDGGARGGSLEYQEWVFQSGEYFDCHSAPGADAYVLPLQGCVDVLAVRVGARKASTASSSLECSWKKSAFQFKLTSIRTADGVFTMVERMPLK